MERLTLEQYREMVNEILEFKNQTGNFPEYAIVNGKKIQKEHYIDMIEMVNKFILEMGRNPRTIDIRF